MNNHRRAAATLMVLAALPLAGCGSGGSDDGQFATGTGQYPLSCLEHQPDEPGREYTAGDNGNTNAIFTMLKYYTSNKSVTTFCDGKQPSGTDRTWAQLYVDLGADPANVAHLMPTQ